MKKIIGTVFALIIMILLSCCDNNPPEGQSFIVQFETNGGSPIDSVSVKEGNRISIPPQPQKDGYLFVGWYSDQESTNLFDFNETINSDLVLYCRWKPNVYGKWYYMEMTGDGEKECYLEFLPNGDMYQHYYQYYGMSGGNLNGYVTRMGFWYLGDNSFSVTMKGTISTGFIIDSITNANLRIHANGPGLSLPTDYYKK